MSTIKGQVFKNFYRDSIALMRIAATLSRRGGVARVEVLLGTPANIEALQHGGLFMPDIGSVTRNDIVVAVEADSGSDASDALALAEEMLVGPAVTKKGEARMIFSMQSALQKIPDANLAVISIPGPFVRQEAQSALDAGLHLFIFSDNVPIEDETALKSYANERGLLVMGPDCGTAIISGVALGFANKIRRGRIGLIGASGTGLQEVSCLIDRAGFGISHAIGTGTNDVKDEIGGVTLLRGFRMLADDPASEVIVIITKPPGEMVQRMILEEAEKCQKMVIANFLGGNQIYSGSEHILNARCLEEAARYAVEAIGGDFSLMDDGHDHVPIERSKIAVGQRYVRGVFSGGTFAMEAALILSESLDEIHTNFELDRTSVLKDARLSQKHCCVDLGEDEFTRGKPHPMLEPTMRHERILQEADDSETAVLLLDLVLGFGVHEDPAEVLSNTLTLARERAAAAGRYLPIIASVCGTENDPQVLSDQITKLRKAGALVMASNARAARAAASLARAM